MTHAPDDDPPGDGPEDDAAGQDGGDGEPALPTHVFFENEALIRALNDPRRGENDPALAQRLFEALMGATLLAIVPDGQELGDSESGEVMLDGQVELNFVLVRHPDIEGDIVPLFTDEGSLAAFLPEGGRYVALAATDLFPLLGNATGGPPSGVVNPGGEEALLLTPRMVQDLIDAARGYGMRVVGADDDAEVAAPDDPLPVDAERGVRTILAEHPAVLRCTQLQWQVERRHEEPVLVLVVELDQSISSAERRFAMAALWRDLSPLLRTLDRQVEMADARGQRDHVASVLATVEPFYLRERDQGGPPPPGATPGEPDEPDDGDEPA